MKSSLYVGLQALNDGRYDQAVAILEAVTKVASQDPKVWMALGRAYSGAGDSAKALAAFHLVIALNPAEEDIEAAQRALARIQDQSKAVIDEALRVPCGGCGALIPTSRSGRPWCICGWNARTQPLIGRQVYLHDIFDYAAHHGVSVMFRRWQDVFVVAKGQFSLQGLGVKAYPMDPRLVLPSRDRMPIVMQNQLKPISAEAGPEGLFRVRPLGDPSGGRYFTWIQMVAHLSEREEIDVSHRSVDPSIESVLMALGRLVPEDLEKARQFKAPSESLIAAAVRFGYVSLEELLDAVIGQGRLTARTARAFEDRIGARLVARGTLDRQQLRHALFLQAQVQRPLGELLVEAGFIGPKLLESALRQQPAPPRELPAADDLGEWLAVHDVITWTQLQAIKADLAQSGGSDLAALLRARREVPETEIDLALAWRQRKLARIDEGSTRLGAVLLGQRAITPEALGEALMAQVETHQPLGQILVARGAISPEMLVDALEEQIRRRDRLVAEELGIDLARRAPTRTLGPPTALLTLPPGIPPERPSRRRRRRRSASRRRTGRIAGITALLLALTAIVLGAVAVRSRSARSSTHKPPFVEKTGGRKGNAIAASARIPQEG